MYKRLHQLFQSTEGVILFIIIVGVHPFLLTNPYSSLKIRKPLGLSAATLYTVHTTIYRQGNSHRQMELK